MDQPKETSSSSRGLGIIARPIGQLHDLPVEFRWEATRRHPYYLVFWRGALNYLLNHQIEDKAEEEMQYIAHLMLGTISVTGEPVDPSKSFEQLDDGALDPAFLSGAVQPMTLRAVATMLLNALPPAELTVLSTLFNTVGSEVYLVEGDDDRRSIQRMKASRQLAKMASPAFDSYPNIPLFYFHLGASQRTIVKDVETQLRRWKEQRGIDEKRIHTKKLQSYLEVWDLREGWTDEGYNKSQEHTLIDIGKKLKEEVTTVANRYRSAFHMITGHEFSPNLWWRLMSPQILCHTFQDAESILAAPMRHHLRSPITRDVPESVVSPPSDQTKSAGVATDKADATDYQLDIEQLMDAEELRAQGLSKEGIARRLECSLEKVQYLYDRIDEFKE